MIPKLYPSVTSTKGCCILNHFSILLSQWLSPDRGVHPEGEKMIQYSLVYLNAVSSQQENSQSCALSLAVSVIYPLRTDLQSRTLLKTFWQAVSCQSRDKAELNTPMLISADFAFPSLWELSKKYLNKINQKYCLDICISFKNQRHSVF